MLHKGLACGEVIARSIRRPHSGRWRSDEAKRDGDDTDGDDDVSDDGNDSDDAGAPATAKLLLSGRHPPPPTNVRV